MIMKKTNRSAVFSIFARKIKECLHDIKNELKGLEDPTKTVVKLYSKGTPKGKVLFSYILEGFLLEQGTPVPKTHTNIWQSLKMAATFVDLGYEVHVIDYKNTTFVPEEEYAVFVDVRRNLERVGPMLNNNCIKIMHLDTANIQFHNAANAKRHLELQNRRAITLRPKRFEMPNTGIEHADFATTTGNDFTVSTFRYAKKKIFKLPSPCGISLPWPERDWRNCRKNFLWFSSSGLVHKGLDIALDVFKQMPDHHLTVCAPLGKDQDFVRAYHSELYETPNITTIGWVDIESIQFKEITKSCSANLHLSCSEGGAPAVKMCMHAGLIPVVSYESGVDVHDYGFSLPECSVETVKDVVKHISSLSPSGLQDRAFKSWQFARRHYTRRNFEKEYHRVISSAIGNVF